MIVTMNTGAKFYIKDPLDANPLGTSTHGFRRRVVQTPQIIASEATVCIFPPP